MVKSKVTGSFKQEKLQFVADIQTLVHAYVTKVLIPQIEDDIDKLFARTTANWEGGKVGSQSDRVTYGKPSPDFEPPVIEIKSKGEHGLDIYWSVAFNAKSGGKISKLWYILDFGRPDGTWEADYPSAWFLPQSSHRTTSDSLDVNASRNYVRVNKPDGWLNNKGTAKVEDGLLYIRKMPGDTWAGIEPRNWSKLIAEEIQKIYKRRGLKITYTRNEPR